MKFVENVDLTFEPTFEILEGEAADSKMLRVGGTALVECVSENNNKYTAQNLLENSGKSIKFQSDTPRLTWKTTS